MHLHGICYAKTWNHVNNESGFITIVRKTISAVFSLVSDQHKPSIRSWESWNSHGQLCNTRPLGSISGWLSWWSAFYPAAPRLIDLIILSWLVQILFLRKFLLKKNPKLFFYKNQPTNQPNKKTPKPFPSGLPWWHLLVGWSVPWSRVRKKKILFRDFWIRSLISLNAVCACLWERMKRNSNLAPSKSLLLWGFFGCEGDGKETSS